MAKNKSNRINPFALVLICACLLFAMYISLSTLALALWGQSVNGTVDSYDSRLDDTSEGMNRSRTVSKGYSFRVDNREYRGYVVYRSDEAWPCLDKGEVRSESISYLSFFPYVNKPSMLTDFDRMGVAGLLYHLLTPPACVLLLLLVTGQLGRKKRPAKKRSAPRKKTTVRDRDALCRDCGNRLPVGAAFCSHCGTRVQTDSPRTCAICGAAIPEDAVYCTNCGTAASSGGTQPPPTALSVSQ
ncbi:MAG: zinc ribbon domain-containing protein [Chloroflexi bacterium]|nr:zinc ribbon domain-containing protein [Chloroflexota bacterium]